MNNSSRKECLGQAARVLRSIWQRILTFSSKNLPLVIKQQHATNYYSASKSLRTSRDTRSLCNEYPRFSWIFERISESEIDFTFLRFLDYLVILIQGNFQFSDRLRIGNDETRTQHTKTITWLGKAVPILFSGEIKSSNQCDSRWVQC